jgi:hypothetical protein
MSDHYVDERVNRLPSRLTRRHTRRWALGSLVAAVAAGTTRAGVEARKDSDQLSVVDMFEMQMHMNHLSQLSEMSTSVVSANQSVIAELERSVKR